MLVPHRFALTTVRSASKYLYCSSLNVINLSDTKLSFTKRVNKGWITTVKNLESRRFERYPLVRANRGIVGCCTFLECRGALPLAEIWRHGFVNTLLEWEAFYWFLRPVTFLVPFLDQLLGCNVCLWLQQSQGSRVFWKTGTFPRICRWGHWGQNWKYEKFQVHGCCLWYMKVVIWLWVSWLCLNSSR